MKHEVAPHLFLHDTFYRGPIAVGTTWNEESQSVTITGYELYHNNHCYNIEVRSIKRDNEGKEVVDVRKATRFNIDPYLVVCLRSQNGPYPYVRFNDPKPGYISVKYSYDSGETYDEDGVLISKVNLPGNHKQMFGYKENSIVLPKINKIKVQNEQKQIVKFNDSVEVYDDKGKLLYTFNEKQYAALVEQGAIIIPPPRPVFSDEEIAGFKQLALVAIDKLIADNPKTLQDYRSGKKSAISGCVGVIMRDNKTLNPKIVRELLEDKLNNEPLQSNEQKLCDSYLDNVKAYLDKKQYDENLLRSLEEKIDIPQKGADDFRRSISAFVYSLISTGKSFKWDSNSKLKAALQSLV